MCFLKGNLIFVTDGNGNPLQHPIKMSVRQDYTELFQHFFLLLWHGVLIVSVKLLNFNSIIQLPY